MSEAADGPAAAPAAAAGRIAATDAALPSVPVPIAELYAIASDYERAGRLEDARRMLDRVLACAPDAAEALHLAGIVAFRQGRRADALHLIRRSLKRGLPNPVHWRNLGEVLRLAGLLDEAREAGQRALALAPDDPLTLTNLALIHAARLELDAAEGCARRALALDPGGAGAHVGLAEILLSRGEFDRGWEEYEWRYRLPGAAVNLPPGMRPQWDGRNASRRRAPAGRRRPGLRRHHPIRPLPVLGSHALPDAAGRMPRCVLSCSRPWMRRMR